jgi:hypothetical protein
VPSDLLLLEGNKSLPPSLHTPSTRKLDLIDDTKTRSD